MPVLLSDAEGRLIIVSLGYFPTTHRALGEISSLHVNYDAIRLDSGYTFRGEQHDTRVRAGAPLSVWLRLRGPSANRPSD